MIDAQAIHAQLGGEGWRGILCTFGVAESFLKNKHGPCPACGGKDRFRFDNRQGRGDFFCGGCGAGDGFQLLMRVNRWTFSEARKRVMEAAGLAQSQAREQIVPRGTPEVEIANPTRRVWTLIRESCRIQDCDPVMVYLRSRGLWPLPPDHGLKAHPSVEYFDGAQRVGVYPALLAAVRDIDGELVTTHVTYLDREGKKLSTHEPRKILSGMTGRRGCAARLMPADAVLGIAEGVETALSASKLHGLPVWAALNTALLAKFVPPDSVKRLTIFADRDVAGLDAVAKLMQRLQGRVELSVSTPSAKDWNDELRSA